MKKKFLPKRTQLNSSGKIQTRKQPTPTAVRLLHHLPYEMTKREKRKKEKKKKREEKNEKEKEEKERK
jgi:hypothetical protein